MPNDDTPPQSPAPPEVDPTLPEVVQRFLKAGARLESIRLDGNGRWWHEGELVTHPRVIALFSRSVDRTEGGTWVLKIPPFTYPIEVEATPFFVTAVTPVEDGAALEVQLNDGRREVVPTTALRYVESGGLHVPVGDGRFEARFTLPVYMDFAESFIEARDDGGFTLQVGSTRCPLRSVEDSGAG